MNTRSRFQQWIARGALAALLALGSACNLNDPDVVPEDDSPDTASDAAGDGTVADAQDDTTAEDVPSDLSTDALQDVEDDDGSGSDTCQERSITDFCTENTAECGSFTGAGLCEDSRTEICGSCDGAETCVENVCICVSPWSGDGIDAAFVRGTQIYVTNLGYIWGYAPSSGDWMERRPLSGTTTPVDFTRSEPVSGTYMWDSDGPTAAVSADQAILFFNGSLYWIYDKRSRKWVASGDLNDPGQEDFDLRRGLRRNIFGDGRIEAGLSEEENTFYLINGDVFHEFELRDLNPVQIEQKTTDPVLLEELFPNRWFEGSRARPWDRGMTWSAYMSGIFNEPPYVVLGSGNDSWVGPDNGPLVHEQVGADSEVFGGAACTR